jgi:hypothetical protein
MDEEIELGSLKLTDKSELVATTLHVFQYQNRGIFGESKTVVTRSAITTVQVGWQRSRWLVLLGTIFVLAYLILWLGFIITGPAAIHWLNGILSLSSSAVSSIQYGFLIGGSGLLLLFWFDKQAEIQIRASTATMGGTAKSYEEAQKFCALFVSCLSARPAAAKKAVTKVAIEPRPADRDWKL